MKRTPLGRGDHGLQRRTPLLRGDSPELARTPMPRRKTPPARSAPDPARKPLPTRRAGVPSTNPTPAQHAVVDARDGHRCVRCGGPATDHDHRSGRGAGGRHGADRTAINGPQWLLTLCGHGNTSGCHAWKETNRVDAERDGFRIPRNGLPRDPELVPVHTAWGWRRYTAAGSWVPCPPPPEGDARLAHVGDTRTA